MKRGLLLLLVTCPLAAICQTVTFSAGPIFGYKYAEESLNIPVEITFTLPTASRPAKGTPRPESFTIQVLNDPAKLIASSDFAKIKYENASIVFEFKHDYLTHTSIVFVTVPKDVDITANHALTVRVTLSGIPPVTRTINIAPAKDLVYSTDHYFDDDDVKLDRVTKVESNNNVLSVSGYKNKLFAKRQVWLKPKEVYTLYERNNIGSKGYWNNGPFSLVSVPFKIRPKEKTVSRKTPNPTDTTFGATAVSGITNIGLNLELIRWTFDRYFASGKKATHKLGFGFILTPGVEEFSAGVLKDSTLVGDKKSKQFFISAGLSAFYSYNGITFFIVPAAIDYAPGAMGKQWVYNKRYWWGFGVGISPTAIAQVFNK